MGLIEAVLAAVFVAAISKQTADEFKAWAPWLTDIIVRRAIRVLPENQHGRYSEEWRSHIYEIPGEIGKLLVALSLLPAAWRLSRVLPKAHPATSVAEMDPPRPILLGWPSSVTLANNAPAGTIVATGFVVMSDGSPFTGTVTIVGPVGNPPPLIIQSDALPLTLGNAAAAKARFLVGCADCGHQVEPVPAEMAERYGAEMAVPDWRERLVCSQCKSRRVDLVVSGTERT
jgi:hypothetical protein